MFNTNNAGHAGHAHGENHEAIVIPTPTSAQANPGERSLTSR